MLYTFGHPLSLHHASPISMHFCVRKQLQHYYGLFALVGSAIEHGGNGVLSCQALQIKQGVVPTLYVQAREAKNSVDRVGSWHAKGLFFEGVPNVVLNHLEFTRRLQVATTLGG